MLYTPPTGAAGANDGYVGKNVAAGQQGSKIPPMAIEGPMRELSAVIDASGQTPTNDDLKQVLRAIRSGKLWSFNDVSSTPNLISIQPGVAHIALFKSLPFRVWPALANTGACTMIVSGIAAVPLTRRDGTALQANDIQVGIPFDCVFDGQVMRLVSFASSEVARVAANPVLWVRPDGNDNNKGSGNNAAQAFATIGGALAYGIANLNYSASSLAIQLGITGTYAAPPTQAQFGSQASLLGGLGNVAILGDVLNQDAYKIQGTGFPGNAAIVHASFGTQLTLKGLNVENNSPDTFANITAASGSVVYLENVTASGLNGSATACFAANSGTMRMGPGCKITRSCGYGLFTVGGDLTLTAALTMVGAIAIGLEFARAHGNGKIFCPGGSSITGGSVTGKRYSTFNGGVISTFGQGANFFPGTIAGTSTVADQYN